MTAGTAKGQAEKDTTSSVGDLGQKLLAKRVGIKVATDDMLRAAAVQASRDEQLLPANAILLCLRKEIAAQLLGQKDAVRSVPVEGASDVIAIAPGMRPKRVALVTVGLGKADHVEPVTRP